MYAPVLSHAYAIIGRQPYRTDRSKVSSVSFLGEGAVPRDRALMLCRIVKLFLSPATSEISPPRKEERMISPFFVRETEPSGH